MATKPTYVFISVPFAGHFRVLYSAAIELARQQDLYDVYFLVCSWSDVRLHNQHWWKEDGTAVTELHVEEVVYEHKIGSTSPLRFTLPRVTALAHKVVERCRQLVPDYIVYDFFALEGHLAGQVLRTPRICSIPALVALPHDKKEQRARARAMKGVLSEDPTSLDSLRVRFGWSPFVDDDGDDVPLPVSDFFVLPGEQQWIWTPKPLCSIGQEYQQLLPDVKFLRLPAAATCLESKRDTTTTAASTGFLVYISIGTVLPGYALDQTTSGLTAAAASVVDVLCNLCQQLAAFRAEQKRDDVCVLVAAGRLARPLLERLRPEKGGWVSVQEWVDQPRLLASGRVSLFVTHGGGNSVTEAFWGAVPMLVVPFFGDQHAAAAAVVRAGFGASLPLAAGPQLELLGSNKTTRTVSWPTCVASPTQRTEDLQPTTALLELVRLCCRSSCLRDALCEARGKEQSLVLDPVAAVTHGGSPPVVWRHGDLLFGTNADRKEWIQLLPDPLRGQFVFGNTAPFPSYTSSRALEAGALPALVDQYHDYLLNPDASSTAPSPSSSSWSAPFYREMARYGRFLRAALREHKTALADLGTRLTRRASASGRAVDARTVRLWLLCVLGIRYFAATAPPLPQGRVSSSGAQRMLHFVIGPGFVYGRNVATSLELELCRIAWADLRDRVCFYALSNSAGRWSYARVSPMTQLWWNAPVTVPRVLRDHREHVLQRVLPVLQLYQQDVRNRYPFELQHRVKSAQSLVQKVDKRLHSKIPDDVVAFRIVHPWTANLRRIAVDLLANPRLPGIFRVQVRELQTVIYLYGRVTPERDNGNAAAAAHYFYEIQLWPTILYTCFESEHSTVYKPQRTTPPTPWQLQQSERMRREQHRLQTLLDAEGPPIPWPTAPS